MSLPHSGDRQCANCRHYRTAEEFRLPQSYHWGMCRIMGSDESPMHSCAMWEWDQGNREGLKGKP